MHDLGIIHLDIKPDNILYEEKDGANRFNIVDFSTSQNIDDVPADFRTGDGRFIAKEFIEGK